MGLISKVLYLKETKDLIEDGLYNVGANITEYDTFRSYPDIIDDLYNNWPRVTASGESVSLDQTMEAPLKIDLKGNTSQTGTPTPDSPIPVNVVSGDNTINVVGKNLLDLSLFNDTEYYSISDNNVTSLKNDNRGWNSLPYITLNAGTYTFVTDNTIKRVQVGDIDTIQAIATATSGNYLQFTLTATSKIGFKLFGLSGDTYPITYTKPMLLKGAYSTYPTTYEPYTSQNYPLYLGGACSYTPYGTIPIELNKIGTYQDYIYKTDKWYLHKEVGKVVLDNTLSSVDTTNFSNVYQIYANVMNISYLIGGFCDNFKFNDDSRITDNNNANSYLSDNQCALRLGNESARDRFYVKSTNFASANELKAYFNNNPTTLYYVLSTPTNTEITNETLLNQLEALKGAMSYEGQTNISQVNNDLPFIITAEALKGSAE